MGSEAGAVRGISQHWAFVGKKMRTDSATPLLLSQEERAVVYSQHYDSNAWVWDCSKFNGNIAGGRLGLCCDNAGNDGCPCPL